MPQSTKYSKFSKSPNKLSIWKFLRVVINYPIEIFSHPQLLMYTHNSVRMTATRTPHAVGVSYVTARVVGVEEATLRYVTHANERMFKKKQDV